MSNSKRTLSVAVLAALAVTACATSPVGHQDSGIAAPAAWQGQSSGNAAVQVDQAWWKHFADPTLDTLIAEALANNKTLQIARARVEEARAGRIGARSQLLPEISAVGSGQRGNKGFLTNNRTVYVAEADVQASWEIDLFGGNQANTAEASAILQSEQASQQSIRVALLAEVARNYFDMRNYERQLTLTRRNLETQKKTLELIQSQFQGGMVSNFDVQRTAAQVSTTAAMIPALQMAHNAALNRLNVLLGYPPGTKDKLLQTAQPLKPLDPNVVIAAPATVLATRPDVRVAERRFAASISARKAATADLFPKISLTAFFGAQNATPFSSTPWGLGFNLAQPLLNFGRIESQIDASDARQKQAFLNYQQTVLVALENMENALSSYMHETNRNASLADAVAENSKANELAQQQFSNGYASLLDVLVAERNLLDAEASQATSDASLRKDLVNVYTAAGGGWRD
ncbi:MAG: efflux transporter outer membrane subunit [Sideroxydans sp.]|nr:efflux transporter outer membrane subunit [Sideroxydans sp.]